jgi:hypothetical protein
MICSAALMDLFSQRQQAGRFNIPPPRLELQPSPYPTYTQKQLDMRRKIEILKYAPTQQGNQTNGLTKTQKWSQLVKSRLTIAQQLSTDIQNGIVSCPNDELLPSLTSSCDVPGPVTVLQYDPDVPLYNFNSNTDAYAIQNPAVSSEWYVYPEENMVFLPDISGLLTPLNIQPNIASTSHTYIIQSSVGIFVNGSIINSLLPASETITLKLKSAQFVVTYNSVPVIDPIYIDLSSAFAPLTIDISYSPVSSLVNFRANMYSGNIFIPPFTLITEPGYIYDMLMLYTFYPVMPSKVSLSYGATMNISSDNIRNPLNSVFDSSNICIITSANGLGIPADFTLVSQ